VNFIYHIVHVLQRRLIATQNSILLNFGSPMLLGHDNPNIGIFQQ